MRITADTNLLVRAVVGDDPGQEQAAIRVLCEAKRIAIPIVVFCEFDWVLRRTYGFSRADSAAVIRRCLAAGEVAADRPAAEAGLASMDQGGDFADGAMAYQGVALGGTYFASFDPAARQALMRQGVDILSLLP